MELPTTSLDFSERGSNKLWMMNPSMDLLSHIGGSKITGVKPRTFQHSACPSFLENMLAANVSLVNIWVSQEVIHNKGLFHIEDEHYEK